MHCNWTRPMAIASARPSDVQKVDRTISYLLYIALMAQQSDADLKMTDLFTARALLVLEQAPVACIANLENDVVSAGLNSGQCSASGVRKGACLNPALALANASRRCGARCRDGERCRGAAMANGRCRMHGGPSTGPRTGAVAPIELEARVLLGRDEASEARCTPAVSAASAIDRGGQRGRGSRPHQLPCEASRVICTCRCP